MAREKRPGSPGVTIAKGPLNITFSESWTGKSEAERNTDYIVSALHTKEERLAAGLRDGKKANMDAAQKKRSEYLEKVKAGGIPTETGWVISGVTNVRMAADLKVSARTVQRYRAQLRKDSGVVISIKK